MEKNKSIDGLVARRPKKTNTSVKPKVKTSAKPKTVSKTTKKASIKKTAKKPVKKVAVTAPTPSTEPEAKKETVVEDFLKPVKAFDFDEETGKLTVTETTDKKSKKKAKKE